MMDASVSAEVAHLLIDIRNNLEYQSELMRREALESGLMGVRELPGRYEDQVGQVIPGSETWVERANRRTAEKQAAKQAKREKNKR